MFTTADACRVIIVEDQAAIAEQLRAKLFETGRKRGFFFDISATADVRQAALRVENKNTDIFIVDLGLEKPSQPGVSWPSVGLALIAKILERSNSAGIIVYSQEPRDRYYTHLLEAGVDDYIEKIDPPEFVVEKVIAVWRRAISVRNDALYFEGGYGKAFMIGDWYFTVGDQSISNSLGDRVNLSVTEHEFLKHLVLSTDNSIDLEELATFVLRKKDYELGEVRKAFDNLKYRLTKKLKDSNVIFYSRGICKAKSVKVVTMPPPKIRNAT
jgi:DNA-binding response OmpR family regulator